VSLCLRGVKDRMQERSWHTHSGLGMCLPDQPFSFAVSQESLQADDGVVPTHPKVTPGGVWKELQRKLAKSEVKNKNSAPDEPVLSGLPFFPALT
jgi:hypothetical protein